MESKTELVVSRLFCSLGTVFAMAGSSWAGTLADPQLKLGLHIFFFLVLVTMLAMAGCCDVYMLIRYYKANPHELPWNRKPSLLQRDERADAEKPEEQ